MNNTKGIVRVRCINKLELRFTETLHIYREDWAHSILQLKAGMEGAAEIEIQ